MGAARHPRAAAGGRAAVGRRDLRAISARRRFARRSPSTSGCSRTASRRPRPAPRSPTSIRSSRAGRFAMYISGPWNLGEFAPAPAGGAAGRLGDRADALARRQLSRALARRRREPRDPPRRRAAGRRVAAGRVPQPDGAAGPLLRAERRSARPHRRLAGSGARRRSARAARSSSSCSASARRRRFPSGSASRPCSPATLERLVRGETTPDAALAALDAEVDAILEKRRWLLGRATGAETGCPPAGAGS